MTRVASPTAVAAAAQVQAPVQFSQLRIGFEKEVAAARAPRGVSAVTQVHAPLPRLIGDGADLAHVLASDATVEHNVVVPQLGQAWDEALQVPVQSRAHTELVVALVGEIQAHGELVDARIGERQIHPAGHVRPVGDQDGVRYGGPVLDAADNFHHVAAHQRFAARNLHHAGAQRVHIAAEIGGLEIARLVARAPVIAVLTKAGTGVGDLKRHDDGAIGEPVRRASPDDPEGFR